MKIQFQCGEDTATVTKDGEVIVTVQRDDDSATATIKVLKALSPLLVGHPHEQPVEVDLNGYDA